MTRVFKCNECTWFFEYPARKNCAHCQSTDAVDRDTGEKLRFVVAKDANPGVTLPSEEVKLELDPQYVAELDGLANAYIAGQLSHEFYCNIRPFGGANKSLIQDAYTFAYTAHEERAKALEHIRKGKQ